MKKWFALDGKELRGNILRGDKRVDAVVQAVEHEDRIAYGEAFYNGADSNFKKIKKNELN